MRANEAETDEFFNRPDHPLMNNVILTQVFQHLTERVLKECRLVCQTWNVSTIPFTRKEFQATIYANANPNQENKLHTIENFVEVFRSNNLGIPFGRFRVESFCTTEGVGQEFLQLCGNTTKDIEFLYYNFRVEDVSEILKSTPKLDTLTIPWHLHSSSGNIVKLFPDNSNQKLTCLKKFTVFNDNPKERNKFCPTFLEELITAAENITCLNLKDSFSYEDGEDDIFSSFEVLSLIEKLGREQMIQEIAISHRARNHSDCIELLRKMGAKRNGLKLKRLQYDTYFSDQDTQQILEAILPSNDTLENLKILGKRCTSFMEFPSMKRLTDLSLVFHDSFNFKFVNLRKLFPTLEKLTLAHPTTDPKYVEFFPESEPCPTIKLLHLHSISLKINGFNQMLTVFPNVTDFQVRVKEDGEEILRRIWTQMPQLESLEIHGTIQMKDSMDCVLTGISGQVFHEIKNVVNKLEKMTSEVERREMILNLNNQYSTLPSIRNLIKLKSLTLYLMGNGGVECRRSHFTDLAGYLGFNSIKSLKELTVGKCELTKTCCEILSKDLGLKSWRFETSTDEDILSGSI